MTQTTTRAHYKPLLCSKVGQYPENVVLCTITTNLMKKDMSVEIFRDWIRRIHTTFAQKESL